MCRCHLSSPLPGVSCCTSTLESVPDTSMPSYYAILSLPPEQSPARCVMLYLNFRVCTWYKHAILLRHPVVATWAVPCQVCLGDHPATRGRHQRSHWSGGLAGWSPCWDGNDRGTRRQALINVTEHQVELNTDMTPWHWPGLYTSWHDTLELTLAETLH